MVYKKAVALTVCLAFILSGCGQQRDLASTPPVDQRQTVQPQAAQAKSFKRGIAYDLASGADMTALAPGVSWWYNWSPSVNGGVPGDYNARYGMDFVPMIWNGSFNTADVESRIRANPQAKYLLVMNEPSLTSDVGGSNITPNQAADIWPRYEQVARDTGVKIVGPQVTWGTMAGYSDPVVWLDAFYAAYRSKNGNRDPQIDYLAFHWYDYGLSAQLDRLKKYGKPFWVTEFANWHNGDGSAQIDSVAKQKAQMADMVATLEARSDVFRYAWFTGRWNNDTHYSSLLGASGQLTELGRYYLSLPFTGAATGGGGTGSGTACGATNAALNRPAKASSTENGGTPESAAFDGNSGTRWASVWDHDPEWVQVDLGSSQSVCKVTLQWESAYGKAFNIEVSDDQTSWTKIYETTTGTGGTQTVTPTVNTSGRYVRMYGTQRGIGYGYSLHEFQVFTTGG